MFNDLSFHDHARNVLRHHERRPNDVIAVVLHREDDAHLHDAHNVPLFHHAHAPFLNVHHGHAPHDDDLSYNNAR